MHPTCVRHSRESGNPASWMHVPLKQAHGVPVFASCSRTRRSFAFCTHRVECMSEVKTPVDWQPEADELAFRRAQAEKLGGDAAVAKHHDQGRKTIRERMAGLIDTGSLQEFGKLPGQGRYEDGKLQAVTPAPYVMGLAKIGGRPVAIGGEDFTVRGGTSWSGDRKKGGQGGFIEDLAFQYRIPLVN